MFRMQERMPVPVLYQGNDVETTLFSLPYTQSHLLHAAIAACVHESLLLYICCVREWKHTHVFGVHFNENTTAINGRISALTFPEQQQRNNGTITTSVKTILKQTKCVDRKISHRWTQFRPQAMQSDLLCVKLSSSIWSRLFSARPKRRHMNLIWSVDNATMMILFFLYYICLRSRQPKLLSFSVWEKKKNINHSQSTYDSELCSAFFGRTQSV